MDLLRFGQNPLWINIAIFAGAATLVWLAGTRVSGYANEISERTGVGKAFIGMILLGGITSLPEVAVTATAALGGNAELAVNNIIGGVAMQVAILAFADLTVRNAISSAVGEPVIILQATFQILLLLLVGAGIAVGERPIAGLVGGWSVAIVVVYIVAIWLLKQYEGHGEWVPVDVLERRVRQARAEPRDGAETQSAPDQVSDTAGSNEEPERSLARVIAFTVAAGTVILVAGYLLSRTGEEIAEQTGLGQSFGGAVLVAISTSLPEVSTVLGATRIQQYELAFSDIFGTNLFDLLLVFVVDALYAGPPVLNQVGTFALFGSLLGIGVTAIYIAGLVERRDRTILRMGWDSLLVLLMYLGGLVLLYTLR